MKIIVGYDGDDVSKRALELAVDHAKSFEGKIFVLSSLVGGADVGAEDIKKDEEDLEKAGAFLKEKNIDCETHLLIRGLEPGEDIVKFARDNDVQEIIMGVRRKSRVGKMVFGSTAQYVILKADCPVVTVK